MIGDEKYYLWLQTQARHFGFKYNIEWEDLLQEFFLSVAEGKTAQFEYVFYEVVRREYKKGITGKTEACDFSMDETLLSRVANARDSMDEFEFIEYLVDLKSLLNETEFKLVCLLLVGFDKGEIYEKSKDLSRRNLAAFWKKIGIKDYRNYSGR